MPRLRVQFGGTIATFNAWSITHEFVLSGPIPSLGALQTAMTAVQTALTANTGLKNAMTTDERMVAPKGLYYPDGSTVATLVATGAGAAFAGLSAPVHCPQIAVVASLRTDQAGPSRRGRSYFPLRYSAIGADGTVSGSGQSAVANSILTMRAAVITALAAQGIAATWVVWSPKLAAGTQITAIQVGTRADTIRHRVSATPETYLTFAVPPVVVSVEGLDDDIRRTIDSLSGVQIRNLVPHTAFDPAFWLQPFQVEDPEDPEDS